MSLKRYILPFVLLVGFAVFGSGSAQQKSASTVSEIRSPLVIIGAVTDRLYTFTDGFPDQFGGEAGKSSNRRRF